MMASPIEHRESDDAYHRVVARLSSRWRVVVCRDGLQWILQAGKCNGHGTAWRGRSYCDTKSALMRLCAHYAGEIDPSTRAILDDLPARLGLTPTKKHERASR